MPAGLICRRPTLSAVDHIDDFDRPGGFQDPVNQNEGQWRQEQFARPRHPAAPRLSVRMAIEELLEVASGGG